MSTDPRLKNYIITNKIKPSGIIHIGAHEGEEAALYDVIGFAKVLWVEADPIFFKKLTTHLVIYPNQKAINCLLSDIEAIVPFYIASNDGHSSSLLSFHDNVDSAWPGIHSNNTITIQSNRLDKILSEKDVKDIYNVLNIDVQGAKLMVIKGIGKLLPLFELCILELNFKATYNNAAYFPELNKYMNLNGFNLKHISIGKYQGEGVYIQAQKPLAAHTIVLNLLIAKLINKIAMTGKIDYLRSTAFGNLIRSIKKKILILK